jgi:hypothetical protein
MLTRKSLNRIAAILFVVGLALLFLPPYRNYCQTNDANYYNCAAYEIVGSLFAFVETYTGVFTVLATIAIAWYTFSLRDSTDKLGKIAAATAIAQERDTRILQRAYVSAKPMGINPIHFGKRRCSR